MIHLCAANGTEVRPLLRGVSQGTQRSARYNFTTENRVKVAKFTDIVSFKLTPFLYHLSQRSESGRIFKLK